MINTHTQITVNAKEVTFSNATNHGVQLVRIDMSLRQPQIWASAIAMEDGHIVYRPLSLTYLEVQEFFNRASSEWTKTHKR